MNNLNRAGVKVANVVDGWIGEKTGNVPKTLSRRLSASRARRHVTMISDVSVSISSVMMMTHQTAVAESRMPGATPIEQDVRARTLFYDGGARPSCRRRPEEVECGKTANRIKTMA